MTLSAVAARYANALADVVTASASPLSPQQAVAELRAFEAALRGSGRAAKRADHAGRARQPQEGRRGARRGRR